MRMGLGDWVEEVVRKAVRKEMGEDPQGITMTTTRLTSRRAFPVSASVRMPVGRDVEGSMTVEADMYSDFKVIRGTRKTGAGAQGADLEQQRAMKLGASGVSPVVLPQPCGCSHGSGRFLQPYCPRAMR